MSPWIERSLWFIAGIVVSWILRHVYYLKARRDGRPVREMIEDIHRRVRSGAITKNEAAREMIRALETGAVDPLDLSPVYRHCPTCGAEVGMKGGWEAPHGEAGGVTFACTKCDWTAEVEW